VARGFFSGFQNFLHVVKDITGLRKNIYMEPITESGLYYQNDLARIALLALEDVMGTNGLNAILNLSGQSQLIGNYPPDNLASEFDYSHFSSIIGAVAEMYGQKGTRILGIRAGYATFKQMLIEIGDAVDVNDEDFQSLPDTEKIDLCLSLIINTFTQSAKDVPTYQMVEGGFLYSVNSCPVCWGRETEAPACFITEGMLRAALRWITNGQEFNVTQNTAHSCGSPTCDFFIPETPVT
jgi:hypothetical protein